MRGMNDLMRQAQVMQAKMMKLQEEVAAKTVEASVGGGMVNVVCTGKQELVSVRIDPSVVNAEDVDMLQDLVLSAVNDALRQSKEMMEKEMSVLTGGMKLPGMM